MTNEFSTLRAIARRGGNQSLRATADIVRRHRLGQGLRQIDLAQKSGAAIATLRRFERSGQIGVLGLAKLLTTLGLTDAFIASFQGVPETVASIRDFHERERPSAERAPRRPAPA